MNDVIREVQRLHDEGWSIDQVRVEKQMVNRWLVTIGRNTMVPLGEGGDCGNYAMTIDRKNLPEEVSVQGFERPDDVLIVVFANEEQIEAIMRDLAKDGESYDLVRIGGEEPSYPHFATKLMAWNRKWVKVGGKWCWATDHKIVLGKDGKAVRET